MITHCLILDHFRALDHLHYLLHPEACRWILGLDLPDVRSEIRFPGGSLCGDAVQELALDLVNPCEPAGARSRFTTRNRLIDVLLASFVISAVAG